MLFFCSSFHIRFQSYVTSFAHYQTPPSSSLFLVVSLKWKPPSENSIDFKLTLHFPPRPSSIASPDFSALPIFKLHQWLGQDEYEFFDTLTVSEEEWEQ